MAKIYGIDLGTTNSLIGCGDTLYSGLIPSIVNLKEHVAGESVRHDFSEDTVRSFKVNMSCGEEGKVPILASSYVLKELVKTVPEKVEKVVISVPAYFTDNERQATRKAASMAGLDAVAIINEPTAAAIYYNRNRKTLSVVFDLGGGTFDVSIIDSRFGNYDVQATDGLIVGGDDFDLAIAKNIMSKGLILHRFDPKNLPLLKELATQVKLKIQRTKKDVVVDLSMFSDSAKSKTLTFKVDTYIELMKLTFSKTIRLAKQLIAKNIFGEDAYDIILVGGSTRCPYLRDWIEEELEHKCCPLTYDPDRIVAQGASYYAQLVAQGLAEEQVSDVTKALGIGFSDNTVRNIIPHGSKLPASESIMVTNPERSYGLSLLVYQGDSLIAKPENCIGQMDYKFDTEMEAGEADVNITVAVDINGIVTLTAGELLKPQRSVTINRGVVK